jgi:hypothetical protein
MIAFPSPRTTGIFLAFVLAVMASRAHANPACDAPECCPALTSAPPRVTVAIGAVLLGFYNVNEKAGTWDADFYLNESWNATPGFSPQTEIVNEVDQRNAQFDTTELQAGHKCVRSRRIHTTLRTPYNLRTFPFDHQRLILELSDAQFPANVVTYSDRPGTISLDDSAREALTSWKIDGELTYAHAARVFRGDEGAPTYDYAKIALPVRRHITFHLAKFFLPLFVIVAIAFSVFWIEPSDLSSRVTIGVTCVLASIAFQLAEAGNLPEIGYLTLADRVYAVCYIGLALIVLTTTYTTALARKNLRPKAAKVDRLARFVLPAALAVSVTVAVIRSLSASASLPNDAKSISEDDR